MWRYRVVAGIILASVLFCRLAAQDKQDCDAGSLQRLQRLDTRLPCDRVGQCFIQVDGSAVSCCGDVAYLSVGDPRRWSAVPILVDGLPQYSLISPIGGSRSRFFLIAQDTKPGGGGFLVSLANDGRQGKRLRTLPAPLPKAAFTSATIGVVSVGRSLEVTTDGGENWRTTPPLLNGKVGELSALAWANASRLLLGDKDGSVRLLELRDSGTLHDIWTAKPLQKAVRTFAIDGDNVWVAGDHDLCRLRIDNGRVETTIKSTSSVRGVAAFHRHVLGAIVQNSAGMALADWIEDSSGREYKRIATISLTALFQGYGPWMCILA